MGQILHKPSDLVQAEALQGRKGKPIPRIYVSPNQNESVPLPE